jgi:hypothetical protein
MQRDPHLVNAVGTRLLNFSSDFQALLDFVYMNVRMFLFSKVEINIGGPL